MKMNSVENIWQQEIITMPLQFPSDRWQRLVMDSPWNAFGTVTQTAVLSHARTHRRTFWLCASSGSFWRACRAAARKVSFKFWGRMPGTMILLEPFLVL
jgi:hypothetical protein